MEPEAFYDVLADDYDLIFADWEQSIARQADVLCGCSAPPPARARRGLRHRQRAIGLAREGYDDIATDIERRGRRALRP